MKFIPNSIALLKTRIASARFGGSPQIPDPVMRIAPNPSRVTRRSLPITNLPALSLRRGVRCFKVSCFFIFFKYLEAPFRRNRRLSFMEFFDSKAFSPQGLTIRVERSHLDELSRNR